MPEKLVLAYVTCGSRAEARKIGLALVRECLVACANVTPIESFYHWKGSVVEAREYLLLCKTLAGRQAAVEKRVRELHSYKVPCIVFYSASKAFKKYFDWVEKSVKKVK